MIRVFIGGSRKLSRLSKPVIERMDSLVAKNHMVLIGDANGIDRAVQQYLAGKGYPHVLVFCMNGACRNNVGRWSIRSIQKNTAKKNFEYYAVKDREMAAEASCGFMLWDGKSKGTFCNIRDLLSQRKTVLVYLSTTETFYTLRDTDDLPRLLQDAEWDNRLGEDEIPEAPLNISPAQLDLGFI